MSIMRSPARMQSVSGDTVKIVTTHNFANLDFDTDVYSGVQFSSDGNMYAYQSAGGTTNIGSWLVKGAASDFYLVTTIDSGTLTTDAGRGPLQLNATRTYNCIDTTVNGAAVESVVTFTIEDVGTTDHAGPTPLSFSAFKDASG